MTSGGDSDDKVVVDAAELEPAAPARSAQTRPYRVVERRDSTPVPLGRGTRDQPAFSIEDLPDDLSPELRFAPAPTAMAPALAAALVAPRTTPRATPPVTPGAPPWVPAPLPPIPPLPIAAPVEPPVRARTAREFETSRDPVEVLRMWPHTLRAGEDVAPPPPLAAPEPAPPAPVPGPGAPPVSTAPRRIEDKVLLAHLALDLYRELETDVQGAHVVHTGPDACNNQACEARVNALRGGLVEACLLVQRVALLTPVAKGALEDHVRELLQLLQR